MKDSLEEKRREVFELHKSWLESSAPLMRQNAVAPPPKAAKPEIEPAEVEPSKRNRKLISVFIVAGILVLLEILFFASEMKWFR